MSLYPWQQPLWQRLQANIQSGRLAHALLISGLPGMGKRELAEELARALLCESPQADGHACGHCRSCTLYAAGNHPDLMRVEPEEAGKAIGIDRVRQVAGFQNLSAQYGRHQLVLIHPAERMNANAANALLKTLEEPSAGTVLLLVSDRPSSLLPTIRSRCQGWPLSITPAEAESWLRGQLSDPEQAPALLALAGGAPLAALALHGEGVMGLRAEAFERWAGLRENPAGADPLALAADWAKSNPARLLGWLYGWCGDLLRIKRAPGAAPLHNPDLAERLQALANGLDLEALLRTLDRTELALSRVEGQLNKQMMFEELLLAWSMERAAA